MSSRVEFFLFFSYFSLETNESREWAWNGMACTPNVLSRIERGKEKGERKEHVTAGSAHTHTKRNSSFF